MILETKKAVLICGVCIFVFLVWSAVASYFAVENKNLYEEERVKYRTFTCADGCVFAAGLAYGANTTGARELFNACFDKCYEQELLRDETAGKLVIG